jgi:hypothetical protein
VSFHRIVAKGVIGSVSNKGKSVTLSAATQTEAWRRTDEMAEQVGEALKSVVEKKPENIPNIPNGAIFNKQPLFYVSTE